MEGEEREKDNERKQQTERIFLWSKGGWDG